MKNEEWLAPLLYSFFILHSSFSKPPLCQPRYRLTLVSNRVSHSSFRNSDIFRIKSCRCDIFILKNYKKTKIPPPF